MFVTHEPPITGHGGSGNYLDLMINYFIDRGHKVSIFLPNWGFLEKSIIQSSLKKFEKKGVKVKNIDFKDEDILEKIKKISRLFFNPSKLYFKQSKYIENELKKFCDEIQPNVLFLYCGQSLLWSENILHIKKFCPLVELPFWNSKNRIFYSLSGKYNSDSFYKKILSLTNLYINWFSQKKLIRLYKKIDFKAHVSFDYYNFLKKQGIKDIKYYDHPIEDLKEEIIVRRDKKINLINSGKFKIILTGKLGTITYLQYNFLQNKILGEIEKNKFVKNRIELRLIGADKIVDFNELYSKPYVNHCGYVENFEDELINSDIYLSPSPKALGSRSRLNEGMAYGCCIITSIFDKNADPNLQANYNCLIAENPRDYVDKIEMIIKNPELKSKISRNAIKTYENKFKKNVACNNYEKDILNLFKKKKII